jgi:hypothetical protein
MEVEEHCVMKNGLRSLFFAKGTVLAVSGLSSLALCAQTPDRPATPLVTQAVQSNDRVALAGTVHPLATAANDIGPADPAQPVNRAVLLLNRPPERQRALDAYLAQVQAKDGPAYHAWLTPDEFGKRFGPADSDLAAATAWLQSQGLTVGRIGKGRRTIEFSGTVGQVATAFATRLDRFQVDGVEHTANATPLRIPAALQDSIKAVAPLGNFGPAAQLTRAKQGQFHSSASSSNPRWTQTSGSGTFYAVAPADLAVQYDLAPAYASGTNGAGERIGIIAESNIDTSVTDAFRSTFGLTKQPVQVIVDGADPGIVDDPTEGFDRDINDDPTVSYLGVEMAGSLAPAAQVMLYVSAASEYQQPLLVAAQRAIDDDQADVLSFPYSECEYFLGSGNQLYAALWEQAAAQGQTVVAAAGEDGSSGCFGDSGLGLAASGMASTPYNVAVGGTDFFYSDYATGGASAAGLWNATNDSSTKASLKAPLPEQAWNDGLGLNAAPYSLYTPAYSGGGAPSNCATEQPDFGPCLQGWPKPAWQTGTGVPQDGLRDTPDISLFAADGQNFSAYAICVFAQDCTPDSSGNFSVELVGGTSAATPAMAGIFALIDQKYGRQGQAAPTLYALATKVPSVFHDVTHGSNRSPCTVEADEPACFADPNGGGMTGGYDAAPGYDLATGLGSVDASQLVSHWGDVTAKTSATTLTVSPPRIQHGQSVTASVAVTSSEGGTPTGDVALLSASPLPAQQGQGVISLAGGDGSSTLTTLPGGTYQLTARYGGDGVYGESSSAPVSVTVAPENSNINFQAVLTGHYYGFPPFVPGEKMAYGQPVQFLVHPTGASATDGAATGTATFTLNTTTYAEALNSGGYGSWTPPALPVGSYTASATYSGDASYNASSSSPLPFTVQQGVPNISLASFPSVLHVGDSLTLGVQVGAQQLTAPGTVAPTGTVTAGFVPCNLGYSGPLSDASTATLSAPVGASSTVSSAIVTLQNLQTSYQCLAIVYNGDANWESNATLFANTLNILPTPGVPSQTTLQISSTNISGGQTTTLVATVTGPPGATAAPTGQVTFLDNGTNGDGSYVLAGELVPGAGATSTATLVRQPASNFFNSGTNQIVASYPGDSIYSPSQSAPVSLTATQPGGDFLLEASATQLTLPAGKSGTVSLNLTSLQSFTGTVTLACVPSTATATCSIAPSSVALKSLASATLTFDAYTPAASLRGEPGRPGSERIAFASLCGLTLLLLLPLRRGAWRGAVLVLALGIALVGVDGCGNKGMAPTPVPVNPPATPGSYTVSVTATSGSLVHNVTVLVTIQ